MWANTTVMIDENGKPVASIFDGNLEGEYHLTYVESVEYVFGKGSWAMLCSQGTITNDERYLKPGNELREVKNMTQSRLIKLTFLDKKDTELIGHDPVWTEQERWVSAEDIRIVMVSPQYDKTALTWGGEAFIVKESVDEVAARVNGTTHPVLHLEKKTNVVDESKS